MNSLTLIVLGLAVWRVSNLFVWEAGVFHVFKRLRQAAAVVPDLPPDEQPNALAGVLSCVWCFSIWAGALFAAVYVILIYDGSDPLFWWFVWALALSAIGTIASEIIDYLRGLYA